MEEKEIQTCVDGAVKTYFDKFAERVTQASEFGKSPESRNSDSESVIFNFLRSKIYLFRLKYIEQEKLFKDFGSQSGRRFYKRSFLSQKFFDPLSHLSIFNRQ